MSTSPAITPSSPSAPPLAKPGSASIFAQTLHVSALAPTVSALAPSPAVASAVVQDQASASDSSGPADPITTRSSSASSFVSSSSSLVDRARASDQGPPNALRASVDSLAASSGSWSTSNTGQSGGNASSVSTPVSARMPKQGSMDWMILQASLLQNGAAPASPSQYCAVYFFLCAITPFPKEIA